ncbi:MAG: FAD-dependent oxidoreductase [Ruminococcaceae bacterium]|nr:FAD-dependent oxidoreductase [Oscillospiraceae bacterium]
MTLQTDICIIGAGPAGCAAAIAARRMGARVLLDFQPHSRKFHLRYRRATHLIAGDAKNFAHRYAHRCWCGIAAPQLCHWR